MHQDSVRQRIKISCIIDRVEKCAMGEIQMTPTQLQAARLLIDKAISNAPTDMNVSGDMQIKWPLPKTALDV